jgi:V/A-type H+-transporting ATPase subunit I
MTLRPIAARWFELATLHKDLARTMECLARTGAVELEAQSSHAERLLFLDLEAELKAHNDLARRYQSYWPPAAADREPPENLGTMLSSARARLVAWTERADPIIVALERLGREIADLDQLHEALTQAGAGLPDLKLLVGAGPWLQAVLMRMPPRTKLREIPALVLIKAWECPTASFVLAVGRRADIEAIKAELVGLKGRAVPLPAWLPPAADLGVTAIAARSTQLAGEMQTLQGRLAALSSEFKLASALGDIALVEWLNRHARDLRASRRLAWVTGWTSDSTGSALRAALDAAGLRYLLRLADAPAGTQAPLVLKNPGWVRAFEVFTRLLGMPGRDEGDPSLILAVIVPVIFGFMFADVGHGLAVLAVGLILGKRVPLLRMLVPGGILAIGFGLLFGSVFCRDDVFPALWLNPLQAPVTILLIAVAAGVFILGLGLLLDAVQAHWRGEARRWWVHRAGLPLAYVGLIAAPFRPAGLAVAALGVAWFILGAIVLAADQRVATGLRAAAEAVEETLRLLVNTISFARVGAFALAHAGLAAAIVGVAAAAGAIGFWIVLVLGNIIVIALEGLVVSIQTTRLMLFEFFIRFLTAQGREFKPLPPPDFSAMRLTRIGLRDQS